MIDIHCHILPDFDDGAATLEEALEMAKMALMSGVSAIVATPHFQGEPEYLDQLAEIDRRYEALKYALQQMNISLKLYKGAEVLCTNRTFDLIEKKQLPTIADTNYVLTEFFFDENFGFMEDCLFEMLQGGYMPIVAHPERYDAIQRDPFRVQHWVDHGFVLQLNKGSLLGLFGTRAERAANELLGLGLAHVIASDAHGSKNRTPHMGALLDWVDECCDPECARILLAENPSLILRGLPITGFDEETMPL